MDPDQHYGAATVREEAHSDETTPLTHDARPKNGTSRVIPDEYVHRVLFLALSASVAMAATAATTVYAYAVITCADPAHCKDDERGAYAGAVAVATGIANTCGILALGPLQEAVRSNPKAGLLFWLVSRATSIMVLAIAVVRKSIHLAFIGRIFEGFATDNLLHYNLSAIYISVADQNRFSSLLGTSLALYMVGMSLSPTLASFLPNFFTSFIMALSIFALSLLYLLLFVPVIPGKSLECTRSDSSETRNATFAGKVTGQIKSIYRPLVDLCLTRRAMLPGLALLLYNTTQSYLFPSLMVYTSLNFSFTGEQNGFLISTAAAVSAIYLLSVLYIFPMVKEWVGWRKKSRGSEEDDGDFADSVAGKESSRHELICAILSMSTQLIALPFVYLITQAWQIFPLVAVIALGLAAPSFIKSYGVSLVQNKSSVVASLAMMESLGGLLSPLVLGLWQSQSGGGMVFVMASGLVGAAVLAMLASGLVKA
ncbi:MFS general substrate transporter [Hypoxylon sp. NC0597]|nr:MFS general substrate transporter [Hypoxylon sp. NC0597]